PWNDAARIARPLAATFDKSAHSPSILTIFGMRSGTCLLLPRKAVTLAHRVIEILIGRLITDEQFRDEFLRDPETTLLGLCDRGLELSHVEIAALMNTDSALWERTADAIDPRLQ